MVTTFKKRYKAHFLTSIFIILMGFLFIPQSTLAVGISPGGIKIDDMLPGSEVEAVFNFIRSKEDAKQAQKAKIEIRGEIADYLELTNGEIFELPAGQELTPYAFLIKPGNLASGTYKGTLNVSAPPMDKETQGSGSIMIAGAQGDIEFTVSSESVESYTIENIGIIKGEADTPVAFNFRLENNGNVDAKVGKILFQSKEKDNPKNKSKEVIKNLEEMPMTPAFSSKEIHFSTQYGLSVGEHILTLTFYNKAGKVIKKSKPLYTIVLPKGSLKQKGELTSFNKDKKDYDAGELIQLTGTFKNTGTAGTKAALNVEVFLGDNRLDILKTDPVFIAAGGDTILETNFRPKEGGKYSMKAYVSYGPHRTEVLEEEVSIQATSMGVIIGFLVGLVLLILLIIWLFKRKKGDDSVPPAIPPATPPSAPAPAPSSPPTAPSATVPAQPVQPTQPAQSIQSEPQAPAEPPQAEPPISAPNE